MFFFHIKFNRLHSHTNEPYITSFILHNYYSMSIDVVNADIHARVLIQYTHTYSQSGKTSMAFDCHSIQIGCLLRSNGFVWKRFVSHSYAHLFITFAQNRKFFFRFDCSLVCTLYRCLSLSFSHSLTLFRVE